MAEKPPRSVLSGWTILVIDDEADSLEIVRMILSYHGANVLTARNGVEGLALAKEHSPRFIISDLSMPIMDGWELIEKLKTDEQTKHIPAIALTAHAMLGDRQRATTAGYHNYLTKPLSPSTLIRDLLDLLLGIPALAVYLRADQS